MVWHRVKNAKNERLELIFKVFLAVILNICFNIF